MLFMWICSNLYSPVRQVVGKAFGLAVKMQLIKPIFYIRVPRFGLQLYSVSQLLANAYPERH